MAKKRQEQNYISNLSMDLMGHALQSIQSNAFPTYQKNIDKREPPFAHGEFSPCAIAILLLTSGLDYHLSRLKYFRDVHEFTPPLPPYFNWKMGDPLSTKIERLLVKRTEWRLRDQLIELTVMRDTVAHPKLYVITQIMRADYSFTEQIAKLCDGEKHRSKTLKMRMIRFEKTKSLRLPLVPTWISYVDIVTCVLVITRFLHLIEKKYGNPAGWFGDFSVKNVPAGFFPGWGNMTRRSIPLSEWAQAFFKSLSPGDQQKVQNRLGTNVSKYIQKDPIAPMRMRHGSIGNILDSMRNPPKPEFLRKPPPWPMSTDVRLREPE